ncbi:M24 family metallopeptidase [Deinococcus peraridilitoris]|nr:aminopeptidase P family protein [Deinococcus peraridilitoris]
MSQFADLLASEGLTALWVTRPEHVRLLSGFSSPADARILLTASGATLYTDARYTAQAAQESRIPHFIGAPPRSNADREMYAHAREQLGEGRLGFEADHVTVAGLALLEEAFERPLAPTTGLFESLRQRKSPEEIELIRRAVRIADEAYEEVRPQILAGRREIDVALDLEIAMRRRGAEGSAFEIIVASGERGAMPHGAASEKVIQDGELVTIDMGARLHGYHSDMTRTLAVGSVSGELRRLYRTVLEAEEACVQLVRPGVRAADLDAHAREILARHDLAQYFAHSLGHGIGLAVHERPGLSSSSEDVLESGMLVTIEPGVYLPGFGGVRIEDLVLVTDEGYEVLSGATKEGL